LNVMFDFSFVNQSDFQFNWILRVFLVDIFANKRCW